MKRFIVLTVLMISVYFSTKACDCKEIPDLEEARITSYQYADLVFIGKVVMIGENHDYTDKGWFNNRIFELRVVESFKGTEVNTLLKGHALTSCSEVPDKGMWLIYANLDEYGMVSISACGLSRSFYSPDLILVNQYLLTPATAEEPEDFNREIDKAIEKANIKLLATQELKEEVLWLRQMTKE